MYIRYHFGAEDTPVTPDATTTTSESSIPSEAPAEYPDIPFLTAWALQNRNKKQLFAWWDEFQTWLQAHPELVSKSEDAIITVTKDGADYLKYPDLDSYLATYDKNPNLGVDKWLAAMERSLPSDVVVRGESAVDPRWLKPQSIYTGMQGFFGSATTSWITIFAILAVVLLISGGVYYWKFKK